MGLCLYDTLSRQKCGFTPQDPNHAKVYVCGPTVYDYSHLGHVRCYVIYDVLMRHLRANGLKVTYVRNYTDVDDKIINRAKECGEDPVELAQRFSLAFREDMEALGNLTPDIEPKVSEHIPEILELIQRLVDKGVAYANEGDVYFNVEKFPAYGKLSHRKQEDLQEGASGRVENKNTLKRNSADFALWKAAKGDEISWPSPWGPGRPGWHIECSAMSMKYLGESFDLHGGGLDLVFPHHENEIAQSEAATGKPFSTCWMHNGFVEVSQTKMSKSLGNFFTAREVFKFAEPEAIRYFVLGMHYRGPLNLDWELDDEGQVVGFPQIAEAEKRIEYLYTTLQRLAQLPDKKIKDNGKLYAKYLEGFSAELARVLDDDLNTPRAFAALSDFLCSCNEVLDGSKGKKGSVGKNDYEKMKEGLAILAQRLGFGQQDPEKVLLGIRKRRAAQKGIVEEDIESSIIARDTARKNKDFEEGDRIRQELTEKGVELMDTPNGTQWRIP